MYPRIRQLLQIDYQKNAPNGNGFETKGMIIIYDDDDDNDVVMYLLVEVLLEVVVELLRKGACDKMI